MTSDNFNLFCKLLSNNFILNTYSANGVLIDFKRLLMDIKSEIYTKLQSGIRDNNMYLSSLIHEIEKTDYPKDEEMVSVQKWLEIYDISLDTILNKNIDGTQFYNVFEVDTRLQDYHHYYSNKYDEPYYADAVKLQHDFLYYFRWYFANELLNFIYSFKENFKSGKPTKQIDAAFEKEYLDEFCKQIQDINSLDRNSFLQCYDNGILPYTNFLKQEVHKNLVNLPEQKTLHYLNFVQTKISNTSFYDTSPDYFHFDILAFDTQDMPFPYRKNKEILFYISTCYNRDNVDYDHRERMYDLQHKFFKYASMIEAKKITSMISDLLHKTPNQKVKSDDMKKKTPDKKNTSEKIVEDLIKDIIGLKDFYQGIESSYITFDIEFDSIKYEIEREAGENKFLGNIKKGLNNLYLKSNEDNYYFFDCPLKAYLANIDNKIKDYLDLHIDASIIDFYKNEINYLLSPVDNRLLKISSKKTIANYNNYCNDFSNFEITLNKKIEYIINELVGYGVETTIEELIGGRDGDQLIKTPVFEKINKPYIREKIDIDLTPGQNYEPRETKTSITLPKKSDYNTKIFKSIKAEEWFRNTLFDMNAISDDNEAIRGLPAVADAIFRNKQCREHIFKKRPLLMDYIAYLNKIFNANIKSDKKLSDGSNYFSDIQDPINQFIKENAV